MTEPIKRTTQITYCGHAKVFNVGDTFSINEPDPRWWKKFLHKLLRRSPPLKLRFYTVTKTISGNTVNIQPKEHT